MNAVLVQYNININNIPRTHMDEVEARFAFAMHGAQGVL